MKHGSKRFLSILLSLALVLGLMPGMSLTARADSDVTASFAPSDLTLTEGRYECNKNGLILSSSTSTLKLDYEGGSFTLTAPTGKILKSVQLTLTGQNQNWVRMDNSIRPTESGNVWSGINKNTVTFWGDVSAGHAPSATNVSVTYGDAPFKVTYVANNGSGGTREYNPNIGEIHTVEGQLFAAPQGKVFDNWLGDDNQTYRPGSQISTTRTLTAQWKDEQGGGNGEPGHGGSGDIVFIGGFSGNGGGDDWGGYVAPQRAYRVSFAPMQGGSAAFVLSTGESGAQMNVYPHSTIWVQAYPDPGYEIASIICSLIDGSASYDITEAKNFVLPAMDVVVYVTFQPLA